MQLMVLIECDSNLIKICLRIKNTDVYFNKKYICLMLYQKNFVNKCICLTKQIIITTTEYVDLIQTIKNCQIIYIFYKEK